MLGWQAKVTLEVGVPATYSELVASSPRRDRRATPRRRRFAAGARPSGRIGTRPGAVGRQRAKALMPIVVARCWTSTLTTSRTRAYKRVVINAHHLADQITEHVRGYRGTLEVTVLVEPNCSGRLALR